MTCLDCDEMTFLRPNECINLSLYSISSLIIPNLTTSGKEVFDYMPGLCCDKITVLWPNKCTILSFYSTLSIKIPNIATFVKEVF